MILTVSFLSALAGVGFAGTAALLPDTGVDGTIGAFLAFAGSVGVMTALGLLLVPWVPAKVRGLIAVVGALVAILTALAAWFLMQDALLATTVVALLALLSSGVMAGRKTST